MPRIQTGASQQTVITTFEVNPGTCQDLIDALTAAYEEVVRKQPGFVSVAFHVNDAQCRIASYSQWERREDFQAMLRTDEMRRRNRDIAELCKAFEPVMYEVVYTAEGAG